MISFPSILYIAEWIVRVVALFVVVHKRRPTVALAWLVVIYFQPWIGIFLYLLIGRHRLPWYRTRQYTLLVEWLEHLKKQFDDHPHVMHPELGPECKAAGRGVKCRLLLDAVGSWNTLQTISHDMRRAGVEVYDDLPVGFLRR